ncbi:uncharacterized protein PGTG_01200 [Puccinia graminis f. sp. tritici CRL 75-36-700-3]|uniref:Adenosine kinase n=1 Tax=Puccinia graminis f. sp. tritici (strain CRL 75-36-700-3 / race SCCL) TaxID=418459 RepID=E3JUZ4_PUCGT|nr:uncharacterized protein PGTG_01200 [Puccinia graminis f. sp. tritici CRL 75-36-700-3]EFP75869.2 hypothetical protein PGTG_01200 [Puccinia graminis f. sp. tritici CRL 75-36-700-3]
MVGRYLLQIPVIRWQIPASGCGWPLFRKNLAGIPKDTQGQKGRWPAGRISFQPVEVDMFSSPVEGGHVLIIPFSPLKDQEIFNTNGAGGAFAGGVLTGLVLQKPIDQHIKIGHKLGKMCVGQVGPKFKSYEFQLHKQ